MPLCGMISKACSGPRMEADMDRARPMDKSYMANSTLAILSLCEGGAE